ncbi:MAG: extracellular catalytic domain type 2 short-chain-length polyhydroxyalkanoate depolymerase [Burkholderiales bacterium]
MNRSLKSEWIRTAVLCAALVFTSALRAAVPAPTDANVGYLPALGADLTQTSVSGVSSGGAMAVQFHVAHSSFVIGAGVLAGAPYYCAQGSLRTALWNCMTPRDWWRLPAPEVLAHIAQGLGGTGLIDPVQGLARSRIWLFAGGEDRTVDPLVTEATRRFYRAFAPPAQIAVVKNVAAGHAMVTADQGAPCDTTAPPFINNCRFDAAGALLAHLYGPLAGPSDTGGRLMAFDQNEFADGDAFARSLAATGYAWVPDACSQQRCRVHVVFHGCRQNAETVGETFVRDAGYNRWASANRMVVLYPQTLARNGPGRSAQGASWIFNPRGCWDWWGYTGANYHLKSAPQLQAVRLMLLRLAHMPTAVPVAAPR